MTEQTRAAALELIKPETTRSDSRAASGKASIVDREKRIVELSFSSETPYARDYGIEILDHSPGAFDLEWLNSGRAPFMVAPNGEGLHKGAIQIGSIVAGSARVDADRKGRAQVKVSRSAEGDAFLNDLEDDIAVNISFGYRQSNPQITRKDGTATVRWMRVNPREISRVPLPADPNVGVGRATDAEDLKDGGADEANEDAAGNKKKKKSATATDAEDLKDGGADEATENKGRGDAAHSNDEVLTKKMAETLETTRAAENARLDDIEALGKRFKQEDVAARCSLEGKSVEEARSAILVEVKKVQEATATRDERVDPNAEDNKGKGVITIHSSVRAFTGATRDEAGLKAYRFAKWFVASALGTREGKVVDAAKQYCKDNGIRVVRSQVEGDDTSGGFLVPHEFTNDMIDLREKYGVFRRNIRVVPMASDSKSMPRRKNGLTAYVIGEGKGATESKKGWDRVSLSAKKIGALARYSSEIAEDALVSIGDDLASEIAYAFTLFEDTVGFKGDGSLAHAKVLGAIPKIESVGGPGLITASGNLWSEFTLAEFMQAVGILPEYAEIGEVKWYCSKLFWSTVMVRLALAAGGNNAANIEQGGKRTFLGYPVEVSQVLPKADANSQVSVLFGNLRLAGMLGDRRQTTIATSEHVHFEEDEIAVRGTERLDINIHDVGSSTEAGPLVAIKSAAS